MKIAKFFMFALASLALASCSQEDEITEGAKRTAITLKAPAFTTDWAKASTGARGKGFRIKHELDESKGMKFYWTENDKAGVFAKNSKQQLPLIMAGGQDAASKVYFDREDYELKKGVTYISYYPLVDRLLQEPLIPISYLNQEQASNHSYAHLAAYDFLVSNPVEVQQTNTADFIFNHQGAILRLLIDMPQADTYSSVTLEAENAAGTKQSVFTTKATMDLFDETEVVKPEAISSRMTLNFKENSVFTTESDKLLEAWIMISPADFTSNKMVVTINSATGKAPVVYTVSPGKNFVKGKAYQIKVPGDAADHSKNPLLKWAPVNLTYSNGASDLVKNGDYWSRTSLYQWGRNKGWKDYIEAQGPQYNAFALWCNGKNPFSPSNATGNPSYTINWYTSSDPEASLYPAYFLMNSSMNGSAYPDDYWPVYARQNDNWDQRATKCGYAALCPKGYKIPSLKDYEEIMPSSNITSASSLINGISELKTITTKDGKSLKCAFHWQIKRQQNSTYALEVKALMVPNETTEIKSSFWNDKYTKVLYFGATGLISSYIETYHVYYTRINGTYYYQSTTVRGSLGTGWTYKGQQTIANPLPDGTSEANVYTSGGPHVVIEEIADLWQLAGHYWTSDGMAFEFCYDNSNQMGEGSYLRLEKQPKTSAFAIRCIKDDSNQ